MRAIKIYCNDCGREIQENKEGLYFFIIKEDVKKEICFNCMNKRVSLLKKQRVEL